MNKDKKNRMQDPAPEMAREEQLFSDSMIAKKYFEIHHNDFHLVIKAGDDLKDVPDKYVANLKSEGVL